MFRLSHFLRSHFIQVSFLGALSVLLSSGSFAQADRASLGGAVLDTTGAAIPGVMVEVMADATGLRRTTMSDQYGVYTIAGLPIGRLTIRFTKQGFKSSVYNEVELTVGQNRTLNASLELGTVSAQVEVLAAPPPLSQTSADISGVIQSAEVKSLPLNGRHWQGLLALAPGAINTGTGNASGVRFAGRAADDNLIRLDGVDAAGIRNLSPQSNPRLAISLESIAEFRVNSALYTAESGGSMGGQVDMVSRSGSNDYHGSVFEYLRNDKLDARSPFDLAGLPPFRLNQFGVNFGGRLVRDRTFIFLTYEGLRQRRGQTLIGFVPSDAFRARALSISPALAPILNAYPKSSVLTNDPNVAQWSGLGSQRQDENAGTFRVDHRFSGKTTAYFRANFTEADIEAPIGGSDGYLNLTSKTHSGILNGVLSFQTVFSPTILNEFKLGANRLPSTNRRFNALGFRVTISGFTPIAEADIDSAETPTRFTFQDNLTVGLGQHTLKTGFEIRPTQFANRRRGDGNQVTYANINDFLANRLNSAQVAAEQVMTGVRKNVFGAYVQDEWKIRRGLTINAGVRYDYFGVLREDYNRQYPFDLETCGGFCAPGSDAAFPDWNNVSPRLSIAWAPQRLGGRTVIRTGFGLYYGEGQLGNQLSSFENGTSRTLLSSADIPGLRYPIEPFLAQAQSQSNAPRASQRDRKDMYTMQYGLLVQHSFANRYVAEIGYLGNQARQIFLSSSVNVLDPTTGKRPIPQLNVLGFRGNGGVSSFNSFIATLRRSFAQGWLLSTNYLWSHSIDDGSTGGDDKTQPQNVNCRSCERASSRFDVRHTITINSVYELPFGPGRRYLNAEGFRGALAGGWELSGIASARTGQPIIVTVSRRASDLPDQNATSTQRPDLVPGVSLTPPGGKTPTQWINPAAFAVPAPGKWGNAGRDLLRGPGQFQIDMALTKRNRIRESLNFEIRAEVFNLFNRPQYAAPQSNLSSTANFGRITSVMNTGATGSGTPRQFQLAMRLNF
jgi:hypothetical protein